MQFKQEIDLPSRHFPAVVLSSFDELAEDIKWGGVFRGRVDVEAVVRLLDRALDFFPHLTGAICQSSWRIVPVKRAVHVTLYQSDKEISMPDSDGISETQLCSTLMPDEESWRENGLLFGVKMVHCHQQNRTLIGMRVSHCALDGKGLGLMLQAGLSSCLGLKVDGLIHDRAVLEQPARDLDFLPCGYDRLSSRQLKRGLRAGKKANKVVRLLFSVTELKERWEESSLKQVRILLAAWLSAQCKVAEPLLQELAVWCDVRGLGGVPQQFTGNCGCFVHYPLSESLTLMQGHWKHLTSRLGFKKIAKVFAQIQAAEHSAEPLRWREDESVLQVNIVPNTIADIDFGYGKAQFGFLLARNSSGIRITTSPDGKQLVAELDLSQPLQQHLVEAAEREGMEVQDGSMRQNLEPC